MLLDDLGPRICVLGPSNSGKSTLAAAIGAARHLSIVHLDQYRHRPGTQWELRPDDEFASLHASAIAAERWIVEGNYSTLLPARLQRATGLIVLEASAPASLGRYLRRTLRDHERIGGLDGTRDTVNPEMVRYIIGSGRRARARYAVLFQESRLPKIRLPSRRALQRFYRDEGLVRP
jgi:adenylate kinase family enzyme